MSAEREMVKRLNRKPNTPLSFRSWIVVPTNLSEINYLDLSPFPATIKRTRTNKKLVIVNLGAFRLMTPTIRTGIWFIGDRPRFRQQRLVFGYRSSL